MSWTPPSSGTKRFVHTMVGELPLGYETFAVNSAEGQSLVAYHAEPSSASEQALQLLASLAAPDLDPRRAEAGTG